jgi:hypothetical protein
MKHAIAIAACVVAIAAAAFAVSTRGRGPRRIVTPEAEMIRVRGEYAIVIVRPATMARAFGPQWDRLTLFYGTNRAITGNGQRAMVSASPLRPLAKGTPMLVISGDDWDDLLVPVYALETRRMALFAVDLTAGTVTLRQPARLRGGVPQLTPEGRLFFR